MSNVTIAAATLEGFNPPAGLTTVEMRIYCDIPFVPMGEADPVQSGIVGSSSWFRRFTCTVVGADLSVPEVILPATLDGSPGTAKYAAWFFRPSLAPKTERLEPFAGLTSFSLPTTHPTTWADVFLANNPAPTLVIPGVGFFAQIAPSVFALRTLTGTANRIGVFLGDGVGGDPVIDIGSNVVTLADVQTLTNKTLTGPAINAPTITNPTATGGTFTGAAVKGYPKTIEVNTAIANSSGAGPDTLHSFSLPANSLAADGDYVEVEYSFVFASNNNDKGVRALFHTTEYVNRGINAQDIDGILGGVIRATIARLSATSVHVSATMSLDLIFADSQATPVVSTSNNGGMFGASSLAIAGLPDLSANALTMAGQSLGVAAGDVSQRLSVIKLVQR